MNKGHDPLAFLLELNEAVVESENAGKSICGPGLPLGGKVKSKFVTNDYLRMPTTA